MIPSPEEASAIRALLLYLELNAGQPRRQSRSALGGHVYALVSRIQSVAGYPSISMPSLMRFSFAATRFGVRPLSMAILCTRWRLMPALRAISPIDMSAS